MFADVLTVSVYRSTHREHCRSQATEAIPVATGEYHGTAFILIQEFDGKAESDKLSLIALHYE
jgi:hypothetical protein